MLRWFCVIWYFGIVWNWNHWLLHLFERSAHWIEGITRKIRNFNGYIYSFVVMTNNDNLTSLIQLNVPEAKVVFGLFDPLFVHRCTMHIQSSITLHSIFSRQHAFHINTNSDTFWAVQNCAAQCKSKWKLPGQWKKCQSHYKITKEHRICLTLNAMNHHKRVPFVRFIFSTLITNTKTQNEIVKTMF